jgi:hypothetical protein
MGRRTWPERLLGPSLANRCVGQAALFWTHLHRTLNRPWRGRACAGVLAEGESRPRWSLSEGQTHAWASWQSSALVEAPNVNLMIPRADLTAPNLLRQCAPELYVQPASDNLLVLPRPFRWRTRRRAVASIATFVRPQSTDSPDASPTPPVPMVRATHLKSRLDCPCATSHPSSVFNLAHTIHP